MIKCVSAVLCEKTSQDPHGAVSLLTCVDTLLASAVPFSIHNLSLGINWFNYGVDSDVVRFKVEIMTPDGKTTMLLDKGNETIIAQRGHRSNVVMDGFSISMLGIHEFVVTAFYGDNTKNETRIPLMIDRLVNQV